MYRGNVSFRICTKCGKQFEQQLGTLAMKRDSFLKCPVCGANSVPDEARNKEKIQQREARMERYRRIID